MIHKLRTAKLAAAVVTAVVLGGTTAAAATSFASQGGSSGTSTGVSASSSVSAASAGAALSLHRDGVKLGAHVTATVPKPKHHGLHRLAKHHRVAVGLVASVNGASDAGRCGGAGDPGSFTLATHTTKTVTVDVDASTHFVVVGVTGATFANVCVGELALAKGTLADTTLTATKVFAMPLPPPEKKHDHDGEFGVVASVNGSSDPGRCGGAGEPGSFTLTTRDGSTFTVNIGSSTEFEMGGVSFANVCVGSKVGVAGDRTDSTIDASKLFVFADHLKDDDGDHDHRHHDPDGDHRHRKVVVTVRFSHGRHCDHRRGGSGRED